MIIFIPLGGTGERFKKCNYTLPKALILVNNKPIIFYLLDNLCICDKIDFVYITYNKDYADYDFEKQITTNYPKIKFKFLKLNNNTKGAAETIKKGLENLTETVDCPILSIDSDNFYTTDIISKWDKGNQIFTFSDTLNNPIYSYVTLDNDNKINHIIEKEKISNHACCGAYGFSSWKQLLYYINDAINVTSNNELYTSIIINNMIRDNIIFKAYNICNKFYYSLGTPEQVYKYEYSLLFDLDGTLVNTDDIYIDVWKQIFKIYKFSYNVNSIFFNEFIKGKSDINFLKYILPNISDTTIKEISLLKDELFIQLLKNNQNILLPGVIHFLENNKNSQIVIVTSCNRKAAEFILEHTKIDNYISLLIASEDCNNHKPHPEPYLSAISKLNLNKEKTIIFEDSYTGYISAFNSNVYKIVLINNNEHIQKINEYKITNYINLNIENIINDNEYLIQNNICDLIHNRLKDIYPIKKVIFNNKKLKTGYICDIQSYNLCFNHTIKSIILKINNDDNDLSITAKNLGLYNTEIQFYNYFSNIINKFINIPLYYGIIKVNNKEGIILDNLYDYTGSFNIDLNNNLNVLLCVVTEISKLHLNTYFLNDNVVPSNFKILSTISNNLYFKEFIKTRYSIFYQNNSIFFTENEIQIFQNCFDNFDDNLIKLSTYPLSVCHGDLKSANIFYKDNKTPYFLDWQYNHLNKGISDITFLLVESIQFDELLVDLILKYYYQLIKNNIDDYSYQAYIRDFKTSLSVFPFFVCVWFNSENNDKLLDNTFPIKFTKNLLKYYNYYL